MRASEEVHQRKAPTSTELQQSCRMRHYGQTRENTAWGLRNIFPYFIFYSCPPSVLQTANLPDNRFCGKTVAAKQLS